MSERPLRVAVVGSGPAGFYAADRALSTDRPVEVDIIERLPTPWGLVRLGVAPDHPKIKAVSKAYEKTATKEGFRFLGNVEIGRDLTHGDLEGLYDAVVYCVGAQTDRRMNIPGEDLPGSWPATEFVAWYNGHPDHEHLDFDLSGERAVVIGMGNVAVDVARMLALTEEEIRPTDTTDEAIDAILGSGIEEIQMLGRRGPAQAAFTPPELKELDELAGADLLIDPAEIVLDENSESFLEDAPATTKRNMELLREFAGAARTDLPRALRLRFLVSPVAILGEERVEAVEVVRNELVADDDGWIRAVPTDETEMIPCRIVFRSVGYLGVPLEGLPFDRKRMILPNEAGRVTAEDGTPLQGVYCAGWIKRGPSGVIGTNKKDATESVDNLLEDADNGLLPACESSSAEVDALLADRGTHVVTYEAWDAIDRHEREQGEPHGRPRVKLATWNDLLEKARSIT